MANDWIETTLGAISQNISRPFDFDTCEEVTFINTGDVLEGQFLHSNKISKVGLPGQAKKKIHKGDILFSEIRPANKRFALVDFDPVNYVVSTKFMVIKKTSTDIDSRFFYILLTNQITLHEFQRIAESRSGTFPQITFDAVAYFPLKLPPLTEQKSIAHILGSLDDKIELNRKMNETLEDMAQALFKSWFVDFDPVIDNALAAGNPIPDELFDRAEQRKTIKKNDNNRAIRSLFPEAFEFNEEVGWIPKGWEVTSLGKHVHLQTGPAFKSADFSDVGIKLARGDNVKEGRFQWGDKTRYWSDVDKTLTKYLLDTGDMLIGMDGSKVGKNRTRVRESDLPCLLVQRVARLTKKNTICSNFIFLLISSQYFRDYVDIVKTGSAILISVVVK